ncbi:serine--tRNA ligase [Haliscomenobacter hydrossis]|uniref:Serine--tRNA ligase n=1 Tax=Haliscomenobacter hydrossis (strain ATCC 27775 / DSM 1100 / LMG 10767 / O) TaxID=760192 RepID=F4L5M8_HALH1|nr:serine--tRNA ligase [Haliscomenobacter hydrossis]AEE51863.1 seryl-tRNA synthetase [Haliscomenobacter hydrossis DSM 1100]
MLQVNFIRNNKERVLAGLKKRNAKEDLFQTVESILELDELRKRLKTELDDLNAERNRFSTEIGALMKQGKKEEAEQFRSQVVGLKERSAVIEEDLKSSEGQLTELLYLVPNIPHESVPVGITPEDNEIFRPGPEPELGESALPHWELAAKYKVFDLELGVKLTGAGFPVYRGKGAKLERALINFFLDEASAAGYEEIIPPLMVNEDSARGTGQLPDKEAQMYHVTLDNLYLIPTAEVPVTNIYRDEILDAAALPIKMTAYTPCFRREAGSYGAHVRGLNRVHQFDKIEIVQIVHPDKSYDTLMEMLEHVAGLLNKLGLPFRILRLCGGDMGFTSALTFDFEVWSAAQKRWLEVSSVSNFETFQSNRMKMRFREGRDKDIQLVHTLNGSALALARIVASILENNQTPEGIVIPEVLRKYTGFDLLN